MQERAFWLWYVSKANRLYASIINPRYFTKNGRYDAFRHFQTYKTMLRIADMVHAEIEERPELERANPLSN